MLLVVLTCIYLQEIQSQRCSWRWRWDRVWWTFSDSRSFRESRTLCQWSNHSTHWNGIISFSHFNTTNTFHHTGTLCFFILDTTYGLQVFLDQCESIKWQSTWQKATSTYCKSSSRIICTANATIFIRITYIDINILHQHHYTWYDGSKHISHAFVENICRANKYNNISTITHAKYYCWQSASSATQFDNQYPSSYRAYYTINCI